MQKHCINLGDNSKGIVCQAVIENMLFKFHTICLYFSTKIVKATKKPTCCKVAEIVFILL